MRQSYWNLPCGITSNVNQVICYHALKYVYRWMGGKNAKPKYHQGIIICLGHNHTTTKPNSSTVCYLLWNLWLLGIIYDIKFKVMSFIQHNRARFIYHDRRVHTRAHWYVELYHVYIARYAIKFVLSGRHFTVSHKSELMVLVTVLI